MKLSLNTDFTSLPRAGSIRHAGEGAPSGRVLLAHDERQLRRKVLTREDGERLLVDLTGPATLADGDMLVMDDGSLVEVAAANEEIYDIRARDAVHLAELAWHLGGRHVAAEISEGRIAILRDPAVKAALEALGGEVSEAEAPFSPMPDPGHHHHHHHGHGEPDRYGRLPGDPHYGHDHA